MAYNDLSIRDKAQVIRMGVRAGLKSLRDIQSFYDFTTQHVETEPLDEFAEGGNIHIKHPGRLTALKERTGKSEAELWATGNAHTRKMITFARNARKWKHDNGGMLAHWYGDGGWRDLQLIRNVNTHRKYDPTGRLNAGDAFLNMVLGGNQATGEEDLYWRTYLGLGKAPAMSSNAYTEWDKKVEAKKKSSGELPSEFFGTTPRMDLALQAFADTTNLGKIIRNYDSAKNEYKNLPDRKTLLNIYKQAKTVLDNPGKWQQMDGDYNIKTNPDSGVVNEWNPLGMLAKFGMKWVPKEESIYIHDTYDFPWWAEWAIGGERPREMKIRSKIGFNPAIGSVLLRSPENYNQETPQYKEKSTGGPLYPFSFSKAPLPRVRY